MDKSSVVKWGGFSIPGYTYDVCGLARKSTLERGQAVNIKKSEKYVRLYSDANQMTKKSLEDYEVSGKEDEHEEARVRAVVEECNKKIEECNKKIEECSEKINEYEEKFKHVTKVFVTFARDAGCKIPYRYRDVDKLTRYY